MKITKFRVLILSLISVLFLLLNGCGGNGDNGMALEPPPAILKVSLSSSLTIDTVGEVTDIKFHGNWVVISNLFEVRIFQKTNTDDIELRALLTEHPGLVKRLALSEDNENISVISVGCSNGTIRSWDAEQVIGQIKSEDSTQILVFTNENKIYYKDITGHDFKGVGALAFSRSNSELLVSGGVDSTIKLWDIKLVEGNKPELSPSVNCNSVVGHSKGITALTFSHDGGYFASGSVDRKIQVWRTGNCESVKSYSNYIGKITTLMFLPVNKILDIEGVFFVGAGADSKIRLWHIKENRPEVEDSIKEFTVDGEKPTALAFLKHEKLLLVGTDTGKIYFWDMTNIESDDKASGYFQKHHAPITALTSLDKGTVLASGSADGVIHISDAGEILNQSK